MRLSELQPGEKAYIIKINGSGAFRKRILEMGFVHGKEVKAILNAPLQDPVKYEIMDYEVSLRRSEAELIEISKEKVDVTTKFSCEAKGKHKHSSACFSCPYATQKYGLKKNNELQEKKEKYCKNKKKTIKVALVGNPNCGKTSIFNNASGAHEHVGNYGGVTVDIKEGKISYKGYKIILVDLPGTYSLSAYTPEELYVRKYLIEEKPDVVLNVVGASALERNLYMTTELIDMKVPMVIALNMYDELQKSGRKFDHEYLSNMLNIPIIPTIGKSGKGVDKLLDTIIDEYNTDYVEEDQIQIPYGNILEKSIENMYKVFEEEDIDISQFNMSLRYIIIKLLEGDSEIEKILQDLIKYETIINARNKERDYIENLMNEDPEAAFTNSRYGFVAGALKETLGKRTHFHKITQTIDSIVTHKYFGFPIFLLFMFIMFETTFVLGAYPQEWIEILVAKFGSFINNTFPDSVFKDIIVDGIISGVGGVIVFLPNIIILYLFIAFMEDSGYMARAAFIMDKIMHKLGLHGKSFIPLLMGFGCSVPAIMSTRTIESRSSRRITMLIIPFMSCSARLPVYLLFAGTFFGKRAGLVVFILYFLGMVIAAITARILRKFFYKTENTPFVMELPPYRLPTFKSVMIHTWERSYSYLKKIGGPILIASLIIWFLGYFPLNKKRNIVYDNQIAKVQEEYNNNSIDKQTCDSLVTNITLAKNIEHQEKSFIGRIGKFVEPVMRPLGFDWKMSVSLISGLAAKEIIISTMGVLYSGDGDNEAALSEKLLADTYPDGSKVYTPLVAFCFLIFVLIYMPCVATVATIKEEAHSWKLALASALYTTGLAWIVTFIVYQLGKLIIY